MKVVLAPRNLSLTSYTVAATAVATLFSGVESNAEVITFDNGGSGWTTLNPEGPLLTLNLAGDVSTDGTTVADAQFSFEHVFSEGGESKPPSNKLNVSARSGNNTGTIVAPRINGIPLAEGSTIGASSNTPTSETASLTGTIGAKPSGSWQTGQRAYLGLAFDNNEALHYGWADITVHSTSAFTLHSYGYESLAGADIITPVPEPAASTLMMVAGAGGLLALRNRRKQAAKSEESI